MRERSIEPGRGAGRGRVLRIVGGAVSLIALFLLPAVAHAQNGSSGPHPTGRIEGSVFDGQTGAPLVGGQVVIASAELGTVTRPDGSFFIENVPPGTHEVTSEYLGYRPVTRDVRVTAGETTLAEFPLPTDVVEADLIVARYEQEPMRPRATVRYGIGGEIGLPEQIVIRCSSERVFHGLYIENGRWSEQASLDDCRCDAPLTRPRPRGVIPREDAALLTEEQKAEFAERGYLIRGYNDADFGRGPEAGKQ